MSKKVYMKPAVRFESMNMSSHIAPGCASAPNFEEFACEVAIPGWGLNIFGKDNEACDLTTPDAYDMVCYHVPTADNNVFTS